MKPNIKLFMKRGIVLLFSILSSNFLFAQKNKEKIVDTITLIRKSELIKLESFELSKKKNYIIKLVGVNPAHHSLKVEAKSFQLLSPQPEAFKNILFLPSSLPPIDFANSFLSKTTPDSSFRNLLLKKIQNLNLIKDIADKLHKNTDSVPRTTLAAEAAVEACDIFKSPINKLNESVALDINFISSSVNYLSALLDKNTSPDPSDAELLALSQFCASKLKTTNYLDYASYIMESQKPGNTKNYLLSKKFEPQKDLSEIRVILIDQYTKDTLFNENKTFYNRGGWGLSFSTGFFFNNNLNDESYYLKKRADGNQAILKEDKSNYDIAIGAFAHVYYKFSAFTRLGPGLGIAVSPFDGKTRYMFGISALLGKEKMMGVSTGVAWAKVKQFSGSVQSDSNGPYLPSDISTVPTFEKIKSSFFIGITYNLIATRK